MRKIVTAICIALLTTPALAQQKYLRWNKNTEPDLSHYRVYWCDPGIGIDLSNPDNCNRANNHGTWIPQLEDLGTEVRTTIQDLKDRQVFFVTAFDKVGNESQPSASVQWVAEAPSDPQEFPLDLQGTPPQEGIVIVTVSKPANASASRINLTVFDGDFPDEGELWINGYGPIILFGNEMGADQQVTQAFFEVDPGWWVDGDNTLRFVNTKTWGFRIDMASVSFTVRDATPPEPPKGLIIEVPTGTTGIRIEFLN